MHYRLYGLSPTTGRIMQGRDIAAETDAVEKNAREKLTRKNADLIVANDVSDASIGFDSDQNEVMVFGRDGSSTRLERAAKAVIANRILDLVVARLSP